MSKLVEEIQLEVASLSPQQQRQVLEFARALHKRLDETAFGVAGAKMAAKVWPVEDFSDWIERYPPKSGEGGGE